MYYLNISLPEELEERVVVIKKKFQGSSRSRPHLTILSPRSAATWPEDKEEEMIMSLQYLLAEIAPVAIKYHGVSGFDDFSTIYIAVERSGLLVDLHNGIKNVVESYLMPDNGPYANMPTPHISLASRLSPEAGRKAWEALEAEWFDGSFFCKSINLLRRNKGNAWEEVRTLKLRDPLSSAQ